MKNRSRSGGLPDFLRLVCARVRPPIREQGTGKGTGSMEQGINSPPIPTTSTATRETSPVDGQPRCACQCHTKYGNPYDETCCPKPIDGSLGAVPFDGEGGTFADLLNSADERELLATPLDAVLVLKVVPPYWDALLSGEKTFEVRRNDRAFQRGDVVDLVEWHLPSGRSCEVPDCHAYGYRAHFGADRRLRTRVTFVYSGDPRFGGLEPGHVVLALGPMARVWSGFTVGDRRG